VIEGFWVCSTWIVLHCMATVLSYVDDTTRGLQGSSPMEDMMAVLARYLSDQLHKDSLATSSKKRKRGQLSPSQVGTSTASFAYGYPPRKQASPHPC
jgi:hypothetical protein